MRKNIVILKSENHVHPIDIMTNRIITKFANIKRLIYLKEDGFSRDGEDSNFIIPIGTPILKALAELLRASRQLQEYIATSPSLDDSNELKLNITVRNHVKSALYHLSLLDISQKETALISELTTKGYEQRIDNMLRTRDKTVIREYTRNLFTVSKIIWEIMKKHHKIDPTLQEKIDFEFLIEKASGQELFVVFSGVRDEIYCHNALQTIRDKQNRFKGEIPIVIILGDKHIKAMKKILGENNIQYEYEKQKCEPEQSQTLATFKSEYCREIDKLERYGAGIFAPPKERVGREEAEKAQEDARRTTQAIRNILSG